MKVSKLINNDVINGSVNVSVIKIQTTPSMKSKCYWLYLVIGEDGKYIPSPISRCDCPVGRLFCSHLLGFFLIIRAIQTKPDWSYNDILKSFPEPIKSLNSLCMGHDYIYTNTKKKHKRVRVS